MATTDAEMVDEVRALTDYPEGVMSDSDIQTLIDIGKSELRARFDNANFDFYNDSQYAERALFWFTCIAAKVKAGEIAGINITVDDIEASTSSVGQYDYWFDNFRENLYEVFRDDEEVPLVSQQNLSRNGRTYGDGA
jgi:hypothetical protein